MGNKIRTVGRSVVTAEHARKILNYDHETGLFTWRERPGRRCIIGARATSHQKGRNTVRLGGYKFQASNVAWLYIYGEWPDFEIDHKDRNKRNDAIENLRPSTTMKNMMNMGKTKRSSTGFKGAHPHRNGFVAYIRADGYKYYLGKFDELEHAAAVYRIAAAGMHGEFSGV